MRDLSSTIQEYILENGQRTFWLVDLHLQADGDYEAQDFYFSTQAVEANSHNYEPLLRSKPSVKFPLNSSADAGEVKVDNTDFSFGQIVVPKDRFIQGSTAKIWFGWKSDGTVDTNEVFNGVLQTANLNVGDNVVSLKLVGDLYDPLKQLGNYPLTQRCIEKFNAGGVKPIGSPGCDWQTTMGGNPDFCDKTEDGPDGAEAHWCQKLFAIPFFANVVVQIVQTSQESSGFQQVGRYKQYSELDPYYPDNIVL